MEVTRQNQTFDNKSPFQLIFMYIAPLAVWYLGIKDKKEALKNKLSFIQGITEGFKIALVYGIVSPFIFLLYYLLINPGILQYVKTVYNLTSAPVTMVIGIDMGVQFVASLIFGTFYGVIISFFLKTKS